MTFPFFTLGGKQFWEDVFYYQKWRIQRHYRSKKYRLLDNWDIRRAEGSFEDCRTAFVRFIEACELPRQSGELVILIHGLGGTKSSFKPLWKYLSQNGYNVAAVNYPSTRKPLDTHVQQLDFFLSHIEDIDKVSFITKGAGCLILRQLLTNNVNWYDKFKIGNIVNINPINCGSSIFDVLSKNRFFKFILGPMLSDCTPQKVLNMPRYSSDIKTGTIFCETYKDKIARPIIEKYKSIPLKGDITETDFSTKHITIKNAGRDIFTNKQVLKNCLQYLREADFL